MGLSTTLIIVEYIFAERLSNWFELQLSQCTRPITEVIPPRNTIVPPRKHIQGGLSMARESSLKSTSRTMSSALHNVSSQTDQNTTHHHGSEESHFRNYLDTARTFIRPIVAFFYPLLYLATLRHQIRATRHPAYQWQANPGTYPPMFIFITCAYDRFINTYSHTYASICTYIQTCVQFGRK